jgi:gliding motility-associated-like protein
VATGADNLTYQWQYSIDGVSPFTDIVDGSSYSGTETSSLTINTTGNFGGGFYQCYINGDLAPPATSADGILLISTKPTAPVVVSASRCGSGNLMLTITGGIDGQYKWYPVPAGGVEIVGEINATYTTPHLSSTTTYYATIVNGACESSRTPVVATVIIPPPAPTTTGASACQGSAITLSALGGNNGQYKWYSDPTTPTSLPGEVNNTYTTPPLTETTVYYVTVTENNCESLRTSVTATVLSAGCAPEITDTPLTTGPEGKIVIDLKPLITTDGTLDINSIQVTTGPPSGAQATIENGVLTVDYANIVFSGNEFITIEACNTNGFCAQEDFRIEVIGEIVILNGMSPNGDGTNEFFRILYIDVLSATKTNEVFIYNRWGDEVFSVSDYDNNSRVFAGLNKNGNKLPQGVYYYKIILPLQGKTLTGFLSLRY